MRKRNVGGSKKGINGEMQGALKSVHGSRTDFLRFHELTIRNEYKEQLTGLNMVFCGGESYLLCSPDHTGRSFAEIFHGDSRIVSGHLFGTEGEQRECTEEFFRREKIFFVDSHVRFMETLNLAENVFLLRPNSLKKVRLNEKAMFLRTEELFSRYKLPLRPEQKAGALRAIDKVLLQLVRLADLHPRMLVVSNLSFICNGEDLARLLEILKKIREEGIALLIYDSRPEHFLLLADEMLLLEKGEIARKFRDRETFLASWERAARPSSGERAKKRTAAQDAGFYRFSWNFPDGYECSFTVHPGEILYFPSDGWEHQQVLCRGMMGVEKGGVAFEAGKEKILCKNPYLLQRYKIFFWGEERIEDELFPNMSITDNILLPSVKRISRFGFYKTGERFILRDMDFSEVLKESAAAKDLADEATFKLLCYRWKLYHPKILVACNVLSRFDPEMKHWMAEELLKMAGRGTSFILLETADDAARRIADRVIGTPWQEGKKL